MNADLQDIVPNETVWEENVAYISVIQLGLHADDTGCPLYVGEKLGHHGHDL